MWYELSLSTEVMGTRLQLINGQHLGEWKMLRDWLDERGDGVRELHFLNEGRAFVRID
jgi:hypothetical protein